MVGVQLRLARERAKLSQEQLAFSAGVNRGHLSEIENDKASPTLAVLARLCKPLGVRPSVLLARAERAAKG